MTDTPALRVEGQVLTLGEALEVARVHDLLGFLAPVAEVMLVEREARARGLRVTEAEVQAAADALRAREGLRRAADVGTWLAARALTIDDLEARAAHLALRDKLRDAVVDAAACDRWLGSAGARGEAMWSRVVLADQGLAVELARMLREGEIALRDAAAEYSHDEGTRRRGGWAGRARLDALPAAVADALSALAPGEVSDAVAVGGWWHVLRREPSPPEAHAEEERGRARDELFDAWLSERRGAVGFLLAGALAGRAGSAGR